MAGAVSYAYLDLDDAWGTGKPSPVCRDPSPLAGSRLMQSSGQVNLHHWGPRLRYHGKRHEVDAFYEEIKPRLTPFVLYGSGDYHYLAGVFLRAVPNPVTVISFDNHPDWDIRPPYWSCGGWVNRALELPNVRRVSVWGCGNFELSFPARLFANHRALRSGRLEVHAWAERQPESVRRRFDCMTRDNWRDRFEHFARSLAGQDLYVTVDLDCLRAEEAITNWENGLFTAQDIAWALRALRSTGTIVGGDLCGAYSLPEYARRVQRLAGNWDHPNKKSVDLAEARRVNHLTLARIWPALVGHTAAEMI